MSNISNMTSNATSSHHDVTFGYDIRTNNDGLLFVVITLSSLAACLSFMVLTFISRRLGWLPPQDEAAMEQIRQDRLAALRMQQFAFHGTDEEDVRREMQQMMEKRRERREWYQKYLKPFTMVAKETDFVMSSDHDTNGKTEHSFGQDNHGTVVDEGKPKSLSQLDAPHRCGLRLRPSTDSVPSSETDNGQPSNEPVVVAASCAICLGEYEVGDRIIWASQPQCRHAFHDDCILQWLSKGKKRCPICRNWFVPKTYFDDLKLQHHQQQDQQAVAQSVPQNEVEEEIEEGEEEDDVEDGIDRADHQQDGNHEEARGLDEAEFLSERRTAQTAETSSAPPRSLPSND